MTAKKENLSIVRRLSSVGTRLFTLFFGVREGRDENGNRYYKSRHGDGDERQKRWVLYQGAADPSKVSPIWYRWLHKTDISSPAASGISSCESVYKRAIAAPEKPSGRQYQAWKP